MISRDGSYPFRGYMRSDSFGDAEAAGAAGGATAAQEDLHHTTGQAVMTGTITGVVIWFATSLLERLLFNKKR